MKILPLVSALAAFAAALPASPEPLETLGDRQTCSLTATNPSTYWYEEIVHDGISPFIPDGTSWPVYRNVMSSQYGATGNGVTDDSGAFQAAIDAGNAYANRTTNSLGTTGQPAVVYIPSGTYLFAKPIQLYVGTILMGDPINPPTIKVSSSYGGDFVIYGKDPNQGSTINFYIGIKNIIIDSTAYNKDSTLTLLDWSISQACQLTNVVFNMPDYSTGHTGISMPEGGSPLMINDCTFNGGVVGINLNTQQYHLKGLTFNGCTTGILASGIQDLVVQGCTFMNSGIGIDTSNDNVGFLALIDSSATSVGALVNTYASSTGQDSVVLENIQVSDVTSTVTASGNTVLTGNVPSGSAWVWGNAYTPGGPSTGAHQEGTTYSTSRAGVLVDSSGKFHVVPPQTYSQYDVTQFVNVKTVSGYPVYGDGVTDDTANLQTIINTYAGCKILFFPYGTYIVTNTLFFPVGSRVFGEAWSAISALGSNFYNPAAPVPMVRVGNAGDVGVAQFSDMLFTVADVLQGCTLVEVNMAGANPGDVGFWNSHFRVGGAAGSKVQTNCGGSGGGGTPAQCKAAFMMMHLTASSSAYIENMWQWTADHDLDSGNNEVISTGRGFLVEATAGSWLLGMGIEHNTLYQSNFNNAKNVFMGFQQSETPYWQGDNSPSLDPAPWGPPVALSSDPDFSWCAGDDAQCRMALYQRISGSSSMNMYGGGFWTFFNDNVLCSENCQSNAVLVQDTTGLYYFGINTHQVNTLVLNDGDALVTSYWNPGGWGAGVAAFLTDS